MLFNLTLFFRHKAGWWHSSSSLVYVQGPPSLCPTCFPAEEQQTCLSFRAEGKTLQYHRVLTNYTITQGCRAEQTGRAQCTGTPTTGFKTGTLALQKQRKKPNKQKKEKHHNRKWEKGRDRTRIGGSFCFYLHIRQCHLFPTEQRTREVLHMRIQEGKEGKDRDTA